MRAVVITSPGGPEVLRLEEVPDPVPGTGEVLVEVSAAGVNPADALQRMGSYPPPPGAPPYPGLECSGRISVLGPEVTGWQAGDEVCALLAGGGYAGRVAVPAGQLLPVPDGISLLHAAALPEAACTVHATVFMQAGPAPGLAPPGEVVLVGAHGGAGVTTLAGLLRPAWDMGTVRRPGPGQRPLRPAGRPVGLVARSTATAAAPAGAATRPSGMARVIESNKRSWPSRTPASMAVSVRPGATQLTVTPRRATSRAAAFMKAMAAPLAPEYTASPLDPTRPASEATITTRPSPRSTIDGSTACRQARWPQ